MAAIGILAGIVIFAINPSKQLADTRNAQRKVDVNTILNAIQQYKIDNNGQLPSQRSGEEIVSTSIEICALTSSESSECSGLIDLGDITDDGKYLTSIPIDPSADLSGGHGTGYFINININTNSNRITVSAPSAESDATISGTN